MTWDMEGLSAAILCDHEGCDARVVHPIEGGSFIAAAALAQLRGWHVPSPRASDTPARDYCPEHKGDADVESIARADVERLTRELADSRAIIASMQRIVDRMEHGEECPALDDRDGVPGPCECYLADLRNTLAGHG